MGKKQKPQAQYGRQSFELNGKKFHAYANFCWEHHKDGVRILIQKQDTFTPVSYWWYLGFDKSKFAIDGTFHADDFLGAAAEAIAEISKQKHNSGE